MSTKLPPRPNLDHLRRQAKSLLADLEAGKADAVTTFVEHLPAAKGMNAAAVRSATFRLADAQSAVARKTGFASWPRLARHVEQLRALEGTWEFVSLEVDGSTVPPAALASSRILMDGDRFRTESPTAIDSIGHMPRLVWTSVPAGKHRSRRIHAELRPTSRKNPSPKHPMALLSSPR